MKSIILIVVLCLVLTVSAYAGGVGKSDRENEGLKGPVQSVQWEWETYTNETGQWLKRIQPLLSYKIYDERGNLIDEGLSSSRSGLSKGGHRIDRKYDAEGRIIKSKMLLPDAATFIYSYTVMGDVTERHTYLYNKEQLMSSQLDYYDKNNNLLETKDVTPDGSSFIGDIYHYNSHGGMIEKFSYDHTGVAKYRTICDYDVEWRVKQCTSSGPLPHKVVHEYPTKETEIQTVYNLLKGGVFTLKKFLAYVYDNQGNKIIGTENRNYYDANGVNTSKESITYEYDNQGNWIKKNELTTYLGKMPYEKREIHYRTITYFPLHQDQRGLP